MKSIANLQPMQYYRRYGRRAVAGVFMLCTVAVSAGAAALPEGALQGYLNHTQLVITQDGNRQWTPATMSLGRVDGSVYVLPSLTVSAAGRVRMLYGSLYAQLINQGYDDLLDDDPGYADLSLLLWSNRSALVNAMADRLYLDYSTEQWQLRIGRHRINWGKTLVWNPNDLFNAVSALEVLYPEGPGADALLIRRYIGAMSHVELVVAKNAAALDSTTVAALVQGNFGGYDIQMLGGWMKNTYVAGTGLSGQLRGAALRAEASFFSDDTTHGEVQSVLCLSADYTFSWQLWLQGAFLHNSSGRNSPSDGFTSAFNNNSTARTLSEARWQLFVQTTYPVTPLWETRCSVMINPFDGSALVMPYTSLSLAENSVVTLQAQLQAGGAGDQFGGSEHAFYGSIQVHF